MVESSPPSSQSLAPPSPPSQSPPSQSPPSQSPPSSPLSSPPLSSPPLSSLSELLLKAVRGLPQEEQDAVMRQLLDRHAAGSPPPPGPLTHLMTAPDWGLLPRLGERGSGSLRMVPVRLSAEQHDALKQWCEANDFSMAVVIRGLVDRFLAARARPA